jgi:hypothetical protein
VEHHASISPVETVALGQIGVGLVGVGASGVVATGRVLGIG